MEGCKYMYLQILIIILTQFTIYLIIFKDA